MVTRGMHQPVPDDVHHETDLNVREGDQVAVGYGIVDGNKIIIIIIIFFAVAHAIMCLFSMG